MSILSHPSVPPSSEVEAFALEQQVADHLPAVLALTQSIFPGRPIRLWIEDDPEVPDDRHLVIEVDTSPYGVAELVEGQRRWAAEVFGVCPATHVCVFRLGVS